MGIVRDPRIIVAALVATSCVPSGDERSWTDEARVVVAPDTTPRAEPHLRVRSVAHAAPVARRPTPTRAGREREPVTSTFVVPSIAPFGGARPALPLVVSPPVSILPAAPATMAPLVIRGTPAAPQGYSGSAATNVAPAGPGSTSGSSLPSALGNTPRP